MGRGNYIHTVADLFRVGDSTVCNIVSKLLIEVMWEVAVHFPTMDRDNKLMSRNCSSSHIALEQ